MDDIGVQGKVSSISPDKTALSHKVDERSPQGERPGYRRGSPGKTPEAPVPPEEESEEKRHLIDVIV